MAYPLTVLQPKRSRIRWKRDAVQSLLINLRPGAAGDSGMFQWGHDGFGALTYQLLKGSTTLLEGWGYADAAARAAAWNVGVEVDCVCSAPGHSGGTGGFGGSPFSQWIYFCCGIGAGTGKAIHHHTFTLPKANHPYRFLLSGDRNVATGFQVYGYEVGGIQRQTAAAGPQQWSVDNSTDALGQILIRLGQFDAEYGLASALNPVINTFGPIYAIDLSPETDNEPGEDGNPPIDGGPDEGGGPEGSGLDAGGYCNLQFAFPMVQARSRPRPRADSELVVFGGLGGADGIISGWDQLLTGSVHFIPTNTGRVWHPSVDATGWDDKCGWQLFLAYAYAGGVFEFYPDASVPTGDDSMHLCQLEAPSGGPPGPASMAGRSLTLTLRDVDGVAFEGW